MHCNEEKADDWVNRALDLAREGKVYPAIDALEDLLKRHPDFVQGYIEFGLLYIRVGAIPKGRKVLQEALTHQPTPLERQKIQLILYEQNRLDKKRYYRPDFEALHQQKRGGA